MKTPAPRKTANLTRNPLQRWLQRGMVGVLLAVGLGVPGVGVEPGVTAERIDTFIGPLGLSLSIASLRTFADTGEVTPELQSYIRSLKPRDRDQLRQALRRQFKVGAFPISQYTYSPLGEAALQNLGQAIQTEANLNGFYAIRAAVILAAARNPEGFTAVDVLEQYPTRSIRINAELLLNLSRQLSIYFDYRDAAIAAIAQQEQTEAANQPTFSPADLPDLTKPGSFQVERRTFDFTEARKPLSVGKEQPEGPFLVDVVLPVGSEPAAIVVFSHGLGAYRNRLDWFLDHLASHGFAVVAPEHTSSNLGRRQALLQGLLQSDVNPAAYADRNRDVTVALDELQKLAQTDPGLKGRLNFDQVGIVGNSLGGTTALSVGGARLNYARLQQTCTNAPTLNVSLILQCLAKPLPREQYPEPDVRIKAIAALHPATSTLFGPESMGGIQVPTLIVSGSVDILAPATPEQIYPFTWLKTPEKYLALMVPAGHIYADARDNLSPQLTRLLDGPDVPLKRAMVETLTVAFMQVYLNNREEYRRYLTPAYAQFLSKESLKLNIVRSLTADQIEQAYGGPPPLPVVPEIREAGR